MSMETLLFDCLHTLVSGRIYPGVAPADAGSAPYITWTQGGGQAVNFQDGAQPSKENARIQINVWASTVIEANHIAQLADTALRAYTALSTTVLTGKFSQQDEVTKRFGTYRFYSCWADISS